MEKWKEEKERKKKSAAIHKKKPFVTGIVHQPLKYEPPPPLKTMPVSSGRETRSQSSKASTQGINSKISTTNHLHTVALGNASIKPPKLTNPINNLAPTYKCKKQKTVTLFDPEVQEIKSCTSNSKITYMTSKSTSNSNTQSKYKETEKLINFTRSLEPKKKILQSNCDEFSRQKVLKENKTTRRPKHEKNKIVMPKDIPPKSELSSEESLKSPKHSRFNECPTSYWPNTPNSQEQLADIKNCVTLSRGKDNARKEMKKKMEEGKVKEGLLDGDDSNIESVENFKAQLDSEVKRITDMCDIWEKISQQVPLSESAMEELLSAVGQGRLLVSQKLAQFGSLVAACEHPEPGAALVTPTDLHGFWDMVFMQVENVNMRFKKLADLRDRNWIEEEQAKQLPRRKSAKIVKNHGKPAVNSRLRDLVAAARKAKKEKSLTQVELAQNADANSKTFEAGFFSVQSPVKSPRVSSTPSTPILLKDVLSNEAKKASVSKKSAACLAMLRASHIGKNVESPDITASEIMTTPKEVTNLTTTPTESILKLNNAASTKRKSSKKSIKVVLFNNSDLNFQDFKKESFTPLEGIGDIPEAYILKSSSVCDFNSPIKDKEEDDKENKSKEDKKRWSTLSGSPILTRSRHKSVDTNLLSDISDNVEYKWKTRKTPDKAEITVKR